MSKDLLFLDLFAGAGGLSEGFIRAGFRPVGHVESDPAACFTLRTRMAYHWLKRRKRTEIYADYLNGSMSRSEFYDKVPKKVTHSVIQHTINEKTLSNIFQRIDDLLGKRKLDLIVGGPPCQAYSLVGRSRDPKRMKDDKRNDLYICYARFLERYRPAYFVFENVTGLLSARDNEGNFYLDLMKKLFRECGYAIDYRILSAEDYGVLQKRKRVIIVGKRGMDGVPYPDPDKWTLDLTVREAFCDLPEIIAGGGDPGPCSTGAYHGTWQHEAGIRNDEIPVTWHQARPHTDQDLEIYRIAVERWNSDKRRLCYNDLPNRLKTHRNRKSFTDRFKVVASDLPFSHTVVAHIARDGHYYIHPDIGQNRSITPREAGRLQTFPDDYHFESANGVPARTPAFRQIGNAVPPLMAQKIAEKLKDVWL